MNNSVTNRKYQLRRIGVSFAVMLEVYERLNLYTARGGKFRRICRRHRCDVPEAMWHAEIPEIFLRR
jgi:hypothetical protein